MAEHPVTSEPITMDQAVNHAARLLLFAEAEPNLALSERLDAIAGSWLSMAALLHEDTMR